MTVQPGWDAAYTADQAPPWDIGRPQPVFTHLAEQGLLRARLLDSGCGTGENTMMAASTAPMPWAWTSHPTPSSTPAGRPPNAAARPGSRWLTFWTSASSG